MKIEETSWEEIAAASNGSSSLADYNLSGKTLIFDGFILMTLRTLWVKTS